MKKRKILIVDDEEDIRTTLKDFLEEEGYETTALPNGELALAHLESSARPDVLLLDLRMPLLNGEELCRELQRHPTLSQIPVVLMSADRLTSEAGGVLGVARCVRKPIDLNLLLSRLEECCT